MGREHVLTLVFGVCLLAQPLLHAKLAHAEAAEIDEKDVVVLTTSSFDSEIKKHEFALVEFYAPWCGHCKTLAPEYASAATTIKAFDDKIMLAKVDATVEGELAETHSIQGYPTLKWFVNGVSSEYEGGRDADSIVKWIKKKTGPPATAVSAAADLTAMKAKEEVIVVGYFKKLEGEDYKTFLTVASTTNGAAFVETTVAAVGAAAGLKAPGVALMQNFPGEEAANIQYKGAMKVDEMTTFIAKEKLPLTLVFNSDNTDKIFSSGIPRHILMLARPSELATDSAIMKEYRTVAKQLKGEFIFVTVDAESEESDPVIKFFGLDVAKTPSVVGFMMEPKQQKFFYTGEHKSADLHKFASSILDGSLKPEVKSEPIPEVDMDEGVKVVVGKSFDAIAKDATKDVLLEVYAPWCGHCQALTPIYIQLAKRFAGIDSVVIAKLDGTENEHSELDIQGFPSLIFYPAGGDAIDYNGDRTLSALTDFIKANAKKSFKLEISEADEAAAAAAIQAATAAMEAAGGGAGEGADYGDEEYDGEEPTGEELGEEGLEMEADHVEEADEAHEEL